MSESLINFSRWYVSVGCAIYITCFVIDAFQGFKSFRRATVMDCVRGGLVIFVWPWMIYYWRTLTKTKPAQEKGE